MFAKTQNTVSMILGVALVAAAPFAAPAFADEALLGLNERAAQVAIAGGGDRSPATVDASQAVLARNETLAQRAIVDVPTPASQRIDAIGAVTLLQNEVAAQRAIADAAAAMPARNAGAATASLVSTRSPVAH